jgi:hypothetical protein
MVGVEVGVEVSVPGRGVRLGVSVKVGLVVISTVKVIEGVGVMVCGPGAMLIASQPRQ